MAVSETWTDPDSLDRAAGEVLTETIYDGLVSNLAYIAGQTATGVVDSKRIGLPVDNSTGGSLAAGTLVYISGYDASTGAPQITPSDADSRQAEYVLNAAIANGAAGVVYRGYTLGSLNTSGSSVGDPIYLSATAGSWTATALTGAAQLSQKVGVVVTSHASTGSIQFDLPGEILKVGSGQIQSGAAGGGGVVESIAMSSAVSGSTTSSSFADITNGKITITTSKGGLVAWYHLSGYNNTLSTNNYVALQLDSESEQAQTRFTQPISNQDQTLAAQYVWTSVSNAEHVIDMRFKTSGGTYTLREGRLLVAEFDD